MNTRFLICSCAGELPFTVGTIAEAANYVCTEEYYAVSLSSLRLVRIGATEGNPPYEADRIEDRNH